ncbi:MAG: UDP-2,3-diacylglucosamine diphosphatase LpxI [Alphaproteobacteria bacterium]|jgi:hypothetical protein|nr:UDP-2,3-diacylglucosamine diphosphatase LpxI [Alphaproteobacteria bacterium]MDP7222724.1 UDP-2,3-diacylglucosamine diphosphatase LpxI [Alphaproteobacteria bacterium]
MTTSSTDTTVKKLAIIAGGGDLPQILIDSCRQKGIEVFVVAFEGQTDLSIVKDHYHMIARLGEAGTIMGTLKSHGFSDIVLIGAMRRPSLGELKPDLKTAQFFAKLAFKSIGDSTFLTTLREELEGEGFTIHGAHHFIDNILAEEGALSAHKPKKSEQDDIAWGFEMSQTLGKMDIGQSVVVQNGVVLGVEAVEGTDALIDRCGPLKRKGRGPILVKSCKPQQDMDLDLPTIGPETVEKCKANGFSGIVVHADHTFLVKRDEIRNVADKAKIFVYGMRSSESQT